MTNKTITDAFGSTYNISEKRNMTWLIQVFPTEKTDAPKRVMVWAEIEAGTIPELLAKAKAEYPDAKLGAFMKGKIS